MNLKNRTMLSKILRYCQKPLYIMLNWGLADVNTIIAVLRDENHEFDLEFLCRIQSSPFANLMNYL